MRWRCSARSITARRTGEGQWIDASQCESGIFLTGATILDWSANERVFRRYGNRSPYKPAAPHGAYRCEGKDRWIAIACFTDDEWRALARVAEHGDWLDDRRFATLDSRLQHQDALDAAVEAWTRTQDRYDCMMKLQKAGVPAGVCQNAEDRVDTDPQLRHLKWLTEVTGTKIGTWPIYEIPMKLSRTPAYIGGPINRGAPCYGEDNMYVLTELLGRTPQRGRTARRGGRHLMSDWSKVTRPIPVPNEWTKPFWDAAKRESLELQRCQSCGHFQHPPYATCTQCVSTDLKFEQVRGQGAIYAYTIMYHTGDKRFAPAVPYASIIVELDDAPGALMAGNLLGAEYTEAKVGRRVEVVFEKLNDDITLPQFRLARTAGE